MAMADLPPIIGGLADAKLWPRLMRGSLLESSPGEGRVGSPRLKFAATWERRRSLGMRPRWGEPRLLRDDLRDSWAALVMAAVAREMDEVRGEGVCCRLGGEAAAVADWMDRGCIGEDEVDRDGGREFRSGGAMERGGRNDIREKGGEGRVRAE